MTAASTLLGASTLFTMTSTPRRFLPEAICPRCHGAVRPVEVSQGDEHAAKCEYCGHLWTLRAGASWPETGRRGAALLATIGGAATEAAFHASSVRPRRSRTARPVRHGASRSWLWLAFGIGALALVVSLAL